MDSGRFQDRLTAGARLAGELEEYRDSDSVVLGLARGGVEVAYAVAQAMRLPLQALVIRKVGAPRNPELALGAVSETGVQWIDYPLVRITGATLGYLEREIAAQVAEARHRVREYADGHNLDIVRARPVIVVDDGIATGASALVAVQSVRDLGASWVVMATPAASTQAAALLEPLVDSFIALITPEPFLSVGTYYQRFNQLNDAEVRRYLGCAEL